MTTIIIIGILAAILWEVRILGARARDKAEAERREP